MIRRCIARWLGLGLVMSSWAGTGDGAIIHRNLGNARVAGRWSQQPDDTYLIQPDYFSLDINSDGTADLRFEHGFRRPFFYLAHDSANSLKAASTGLWEVDDTLKAIRRHAVTSANAGANDANDFESTEKAVRESLEHISRVARGTAYKGHRLLDGSAGLMAVSSDPSAFRGLRATTDTTNGQYVVTVSKPGTRATIKAAPQVESLAQDEILNINGVNIEMFAGMDSSDVVNRINEYTLLTAAFATHQDDVTQVSSRHWGSEAHLNLISNRAPGIDSTGFDNTVVSASGLDVEISVDDLPVPGRGRTVTVNRGSGKGLSLDVAVDAVDPSTTVATTATISVVDNSFDWTLLPSELGERLKVSIPSMSPDALGLGVLNNPFARLNDIEVYGAASARDALAIIDASISEVEHARGALERLLQQYHEPQGQAFVTAGDATAGARVAIDLAPLSEGQLVDKNTLFDGETIELESQVLTESGATAMYLGFRLTENELTHYGWLRLGIDSSDRLTLKDLAYELVEDRGIRVGYVPEPTTAILAWGCPLMWPLIRRRVKTGAIPRF